MTARGRGALRKALLGSVAEEVVRTSVSPLLLVGPGVSANWALGEDPLVIAGLDGSTTSLAAARAAGELAAAIDARVRALEVLRPSDVVAVGDFPGGDVALLQAAVADLSGRGVAADYELVDGYDAADTLAKQAASEHAAIIAVASHGRTGLARAVLGSIAMRTIRHAGCPVLVTGPRCPSPRDRRSDGHHSGSHQHLSTGREAAAQVSLRTASARCSSRRAHSTAGSASGATGQVGERGFQSRTLAVGQSPKMVGAVVERQPTVAREIEGASRDRHVRRPSARSFRRGHRRGDGAMRPLPARSACTRTVAYGGLDGRSQARGGAVVSWRRRLMVVLPSCPLLGSQCRPVPPRRPGPKVPAGRVGRAKRDLRPWAAGPESVKVGP